MNSGSATNLVELSGLFSQFIVSLRELRLRLL